VNRRNFLRSASALALSQMAPSWLSGVTATAAPRPDPAETSAPSPNLIQTMNAMGPTTPVRITRLRDTLFLLQGVGGNMVAQIGPDGKLLIDSSIATAASRVRGGLTSLGQQPLQLLINTHWHFDHTDGNAAMHSAGALILAHENTRLRMSRPQRIEAINLDFPAAPNSALPQEVFEDRSHIFFNNDELRLVHFAPAHTDSDIYILFKEANVIHAGDIWFNGTYPLIDDSSGGRIDGMIRAASELVALADAQTKIVPGHGPLGTKPELLEYRDMLVSVRDRVQGLKRSGRSLPEAQAAKPTSDLDKKWGNSSMTPDLFVQQVYKTLSDGRA
jgi:cyclase